MKTLELFGEVGNEITLDGVKNFINANKSEELNFKISTLGGNLASAITIHNLIKAHSQKTTAEIVGLTASAGTVIAIACDEVIMSDNSLFLIHNGWTNVTGNAFDMQKMAGDLMKNDAIMVKMYKDRTGKDEKLIKDLMKAADWLSPAEALKLGFVDKINYTGQKIAASFSAAQRNQLSKLLFTKLEEKMKIFGKEKKDVPVLNVLALKDGKQLLINAELPTTGAEVSPLGAATLEDGEYELADGKKITVAGGVITNVSEMEAIAETEAIVAAVTEVVKSEIAKVKAEIEASVKAELAAITSKHIPVKGAGADNGGKKVAFDIQSKIDSVTGAIREGIVNARKA
jgi:ATP-dependent protease ClpP protease subunit